LLDPKSLDACSAVNSHWELLVRQVREDKECRSSVQKDFLQLQELCPRKTIPNYAKRVDVQIPQLNDEGEVIQAKDKEQNKRRKSKQTEDFGLQAAYKGLKTHKIELEERNVFCGSYKTHVLMEHSDRARIIHYRGGDVVVTTSANRKVRLLRVPGGQEEPLLLQGHAGPIRALCLSEDKGLLASSSFDLSIRYWNIPSGACLRTFTGHYGTVTCLDCHEEHFVSGAGDGVVKVWSLKSGKCLRTLMHKSPVWTVRMDGTHVVSGCHRGLVKVWSTETGALLKTLERHQGPVLCLAFDQWHLVTGSSDGYALGWSMLGNLRKCLAAFFHPKEVLSLAFLYLRVITACADGHIRIFNFLTGTCLRVLEPTSSGDPLTSLCAAGNRVVTNSRSSVVLLQFEDVLWDYSLPADREVPKDKRSRRGQRQAQDKSAKSRGRPKSITLSLCFSGFFKLIYKPSTHCLQPSPNSFSLLLSRADGVGKAPKPKCVALFLDADGEAEQGPAPPAPEQAEEQPELPKRDPSCPMSPDKFLLTIGTLRNSCKPAPGSSCPELSAKAREAQQQRPRKVPVSKAQHREEQAAQLQRARLHTGSLTMTKISTPFETKKLRLRLQKSLHSPTVRSSIPAPCLVRPKFCGSLRGRKSPSGRGKETPGAKDGAQLIDLCTASSELLQPTPGSAARTTSGVPGGIKPSWPHGSRRDSELRLLRAEQEVCEAPEAAQHQAQQAKPTEDERRARRKAWLRKIKGLPVDSFTGERKTPAPELGHNTFI
ncbi:FBW10 protein, partial [Erpornis zantholeuca]|nr:FBW10 protein [Erpornis zantholeuca]